MTQASLTLLMVPREGGSATAVFLIQMVAIFAIFYFLLIRPQSKERERHETMLKGISKGDEIVTNGGIVGTVVHAQEDRLTVRTGENTRLTVERGRVARVIDGKTQKEQE